MANFAVKFGLFGSTLGLLAGLIELTIGAQIRPWIGNKENPFVLGLVTLFLSAVALGSIASARHAEFPTNDGKLAIFLGVFVPAVICLTTVGRLWYLPGSLLLTAAFLFARQFWFGASPADAHMALPSLNSASRLIAGMGGVVVLAAVGLAFWKSKIGLFGSEVFIQGERFRFEVLPMDFVRRMYWSSDIPLVDEFEVTQVMIVYILLLMGATLAVLASLAASRFFTGFGGLTILIGLALFIFWLPRILAQAHYSPVSYFNIIRSLGWGWFISAFGMSLILIASLLRRHTD